MLDSLASASVVSFSNPSLYFYVNIVNANFFRYGVFTLSSKRLASLQQM